MYKEIKDPDLLLLIALSAGIIDYRLGRGGAEAFWSGLLRLAKGKRINTSSIEFIKSLMNDFINLPVNARSRKQKIRRIHLFTKSGLINEILRKGLEEISSDPVWLWKELARTLGSPMKAKTIVFAMKLLDITSLIVLNKYAEFPIAVPIPLDFHITAMAIASGIVSYNRPIDYKWREVNSIKTKHKSIFLEAWRLVAEVASYEMRRELPLLRLDSLIWQVSKISKKENYVKATCKGAITEYLIEKAEVSRSIAEEVASQLTFNMK